MFGTLKNAYELAKDLTALQVSNEYKTKIAELFEAVIAAREDALTAQEERAALLAEIRQLKEQAAQREDWRAEQQRYDLTSLYRGVVAYLLKPEHRVSQDPHALCAQCFKGGKAGFLQASGAPGSWRLVEHRCSLCGSKASFPDGAIEKVWQGAKSEEV